MPATVAAPALPPAPSCRRRPGGAARGRTHRRTAGVLGALLVGVSMVLTGCGSAQVSTLHGATATATAAETATAQITMPDVVGMRGDAAAEALRSAGLTATPTLTDAEGKESVWMPSGWTVTTQDPAAGTVVAADESLSLTVGRDEAEVKATQEARAQSSRQAAELAAARRAGEQKAAEERAAAQQSATEQEAGAEASQQAAEQDAGPSAEARSQAQAGGEDMLGPAQDDEEQDWEEMGWEEDAEEPGGAGLGTPAPGHYATCREAREAGAAPLYEGRPGYRADLDRDGDGIACEAS